MEAQAVFDGNASDLMEGESGESGARGSLVKSYRAPTAVFSGGQRWGVTAGGAGGSLIQACRRHSTWPSGRWDPKWAALPRRITEGGAALHCADTGCLRATYGLPTEPL